MSFPYAPQAQVGLVPLSPPVAFPLDAHPAFDVPEIGDLAVVACTFNPAGFKRPIDNLAVWLSWLWGLRVPLYMAEMAFGDQSFILPSGHRRVAQVRGCRSKNVLFQKEPLWNIAEKLVPSRFTKILFLDADVILRARRWSELLSSQLDGTKIVQPFSRCFWTAPDGREILAKPSWGYAWSNRYPYPDSTAFHPGFGYAVDRSFFSDCGGFPLSGIFGGGDVVTGLAAMNRHHPGGHSRLWDHIRWLPRDIEWADRVARWSEGRLGALTSDAVHLWHGSVQNRQHQKKHVVAAQLGHDPELDVRLGANGLAEWTPHAISTKPTLISYIGDYFPSRQEDTPQLQF
jgi:hypothetical protein